MGLDFGNYQIFCGDRGREEFRQGLLDGLPRLLHQHGYNTITDPKNADRVIVVGPPDRWIVIYDSFALSAATEAKAAAEELAFDLSKARAVVQIDVDDGAWLKLSLYRTGYRIDQFFNYPAQLVYWIKQKDPLATSIDSDFYGQPEKWKDLLLTPANSTALREVWYPKASCNETLQRTALLLGWNPVFCQRGYEVASDGMPAFFYDSDWMGAGNIDFSGFHAFYFNKTI